MATTIGDQRFQGQLLQVLGRIASALEEEVARARQTDVDTDSIGALAIWREEVASKDTILGFSDWVAWRSGTHQGDTDE